MSDPIAILFNNALRVGSLPLMPAPDAFMASRLASGFRLQIPVRVALGRTGDQCPLRIEHLCVTFFSVAPHGIEIEIGTAFAPHGLSTAPHEWQIALGWDWTLPTLAAYERIRDGRAPTFRVTVTGELRVRFPNEQNLEVWSLPDPFVYHGNVKYSRDAWTKTLRILDIQDAVLVEIPYSADPPSTWKPVFDALTEARNAFDAGGTTGWNHCVTGIRKALEAWRVIEGEDQGIGTQPLRREERDARTKNQRLDSLRYHLMQYAHQSAHSSAERWTRDDAVLALATLGALLAVRKP